MLRTYVLFVLFNFAGGGYEWREFKTYKTLEECRKDRARMHYVGVKSHCGDREHSQN